VGKSIASRFENVYLILPLWFNQYYLQPYKMLERLGEALLYVGSERICYGSEAFIWPHVQTYIDTLANLVMPDELQDTLVFGAAVMASSREAAAARQFVDFLRSQEAAMVIAAKGMDPA